MTVREQVRQSIAQRADALRRARESGSGWWAAARALFHNLDDRVVEEAERRAGERATSRYLANRAFDPGSFPASGLPSRFPGARKRPRRRRRR